MTKSRTTFKCDGCGKKFRLPFDGRSLYCMECQKLIMDYNKKVMNKEAFYRKAYTNKYDK